MPPISDRLKRQVAPKLFSLFDERRVRVAECDWDSLSLMGGTQGEIRKRVIEIFTPLKVKANGLRCEVCGWTSPDPGLTVLHHLERASFISLWMSVYSTRDARQWDLRRESPDREVLISQVVALHRLENLALLCVSCHATKAHPSNRQLNTKCSAKVEEIQRLKAQQGFTPVWDYSRM